MAVNFVTSTQVLNINGQNFYTPDFVAGTVSGVTRNISCVNSEIVGAEWMMPRVSAGLPTIPFFEYAVATDSIKPTVDAVKVLVVKEIGNGGINVYKLAIADTDYTDTGSPLTVTNQFGSLCDGLGGSLAVMPAVTIPFPLIQDAPVTTATNGDKTYIFPFPANPNGLEYSIPVVYFNGVAPATAYAPSGITTAAGFVIWATANWSDYGTWTSSGDIVKLVSATGSTVYVTATGLIVSLAPAAWCIDCTPFSSNAAVNGLKFGSGTTIAFPAFTLTDQTAQIQQLINSIRPLFESGATFSIGGTGNKKINITTVQATPKIYYNTSLIATASAGVCS